MIDTSKESLLSMSQAAAVCPRVDGKKPHAGSIWRWARMGVKGIQLEHVMIGRRLCTTKEAMDRFFVALAEAPRPERYRNRPPQVSRSDSQRQREIAKAKERLRKNGFIKPRTEH